MNDKDIEAVARAIYEKSPLYRFKEADPDQVVNTLKEGFEKIPFDQVSIALNKETYDMAVAAIKAYEESKQKRELDTAE